MNLVAIQRSTIWLSGGVNSVASHRLTSRGIHRMVRGTAVDKMKRPRTTRDGCNDVFDVPTQIPCIAREQGQRLVHASLLRRGIHPWIMPRVRSRALPAQWFHAGITRIVTASTCLALASRSLALAASRARQAEVGQE